MLFFSTIFFARLDLLFEPDTVEILSSLLSSLECKSSWFAVTLTEFLLLFGLNVDKWAV
jgi:hypothetical protein